MLCSTILHAPTEQKGNANCMTVVCDYDSMGQPGDQGDSMIVTSCTATNQRARRDTNTVMSAHKTTLKDESHINNW